MNRGPLSARLDEMHRSGQLAAMIQWKPRPKVVDVSGRRWTRERVPLVVMTTPPPVPDIYEPWCDERGRHSVTVRSIMQVVADEYGITVSDIRGPKRPKALSVPRQIVMYLAREMTEFSWPMIGSFMRGRDHSTIIHGWRRTKARIEQDADFARRVEVIRERVFAKREAHNV